MVSRQNFILDYIMIIGTRGFWLITGLILITVCITTISIASTISDNTYTNIDDKLIKVDHHYIVDNDIDLGGKILKISDNDIYFKGGSIYNGVVLFNNVSLYGDVKCFAKIDRNSKINNPILDVSWFTRNISCGAKNLDVAEVINDLIVVSQNHGDGQYRSNSTIYLPSGIYYCNAPINVPADGSVQHLHMKGDQGTKIVAVNKMEYLFGRTLSESTSDHIGTEVVLESIVFDGNFNVKHTLNLSLMSCSTFRNISSLAGKETNLYMNYAFIDNFYDCTFMSWDVFRPTNINVYLGPQDVNAINFYGCRFESANLGIYSSNGYAVNLNGCTLEGHRAVAIYVRNTDQFTIRDCYFEDNSTTRRSRKRKDFDWKTFGFKGCTVVINNEKTKIPFEIHADIIINPHKLSTNEDFTNSAIEINEMNTQEFSSQRMISCSGNSSQRINSCTHDNELNVKIPNDCFIFASSTQGIYASGNSICSIYVDDVNSKYHWAMDYQPQVLLTAKYDKVNNINNISLEGNTSANKQLNSYSEVEFK